MTTRFLAATSAMPPCPDIALSFANVRLSLADVALSLANVGLSLADVALSLANVAPALSLAKGERTACKRRGLRLQTGGLRLQARASRMQAWGFLMHTGAFPSAGGRASFCMRTASFRKRRASFCEREALFLQAGGLFLQATRPVSASERLLHADCGAPCANVGLLFANGRIPFVNAGSRLDTPFRSANGRGCRKDHNACCGDFALRRPRKAVFARLSQVRREGLTNEKAGVFCLIIVGRCC